MNEDYQELYHKGATLMKSALEKYGKGDFEGGETDRKEANRYFDLANSEVNAATEKMNALYGESRNFGIIYKVIEENANDLLSNESKRKAYSKIINEIRKDRTLKKQFNVYEALRNPLNVDYPSTYVNDVIALASDGLTEERMRDSNEKLIKLIEKGGLDECVDIDDEEMDLYESVEYLLTHKPSIKSMAEYSNAKGLVSEYVERHNVKKEENTVSESEYKNKLKSITEKYSNELTEGEMELMRMVESADDKEKLFNEKKNEAIKSIQESAGSDADEVLEKLNEKAYNEKTLMQDIAEFSEITNIMSE